MEQQWSVRDDSPYRRRPLGAYAWWPFALVLALIGAAAGVYYWWPRPEPAPLALPAPTPAPQVEPAPQAAAEPAIRHPLEMPAPEAAARLPSLDNSDSMMRELLSGLLGAKPFAALVYPSGIVRRTVATVDNLPREAAPTRVLPWQPARGVFAVSSAGELAIAARNAVRYEAYVRAAQAIDTGELVRRYAEAYPLFQRAYEELGYPNRYFNDRLMEAIDDLLAAPEPPEPTKLVQPKVLYEFADPDLQARSAGQKIMMRAGRENERKLKAKLREIRQALLAAGAPR